MKLILGWLVVALLLLGACDVEREPPRPGPYGELESEFNNLEVVTEKIETLIFTL